MCGGGVLCEAHNDVGFLTFDACAATPGLEALRRADGLWVPVEEAAAQPGGELVLIVMVGDTLGYLTKDYYTPCRHRVVRPPDGARIGLPILFRGRSDAVLNTRPALDAASAAGGAHRRDGDDDAAALRPSPRPSRSAQLVQSVKA